MFKVVNGLVDWGGSVRISDAAVAEWLPERTRLKLNGYPDRPPDIDGPSLRAWLPRLGERTVPYFRDPPVVPALLDDPRQFPVFTVTWHQGDSPTYKVFLTGLSDGSFMNRVVIVDPSGDLIADKAHLLDPTVDPNSVWQEIETVVRTINEAPVDWGPEGVLVTDYGAFLALDEEVETAKAEARAAGLLAPQWMH